MNITATDIDTADRLHAIDTYMVDEVGTHGAQNIWGGRDYRCGAVTFRTSVDDTRLSLILLDARNCLLARVSADYVKPEVAAALAQALLLQVWS
jgi:hypothetical protein